MASTLAAFRSTSPRVLEVWDEYEKDHRAWLRKIKKAEKQMAAAQGLPGEKARIWYYGRPNDSRHVVIGVQHLQLPREEGEPSWGRRRKDAPIPPGWRHLVDDDYLTPIPENGRKGGDPKSPEAVAARELLQSLQPPKTVANRFHDEFGMPIIVHEDDGNHIYWPSMEPIEADGGRLILVCWATTPSNVSRASGNMGWKGGGAFELIKPSEYYALKGE
jgi:hypothetical protein